MSVATLAAVAMGGAVGASLRYLTVLGAARLFGSGFPLGTLTVNVAGSLIIGAITGFVLARTPMSETLRGFLVIGLLGGFTTFSAFSLDVLTLIDRKEILSAGLYILLSVGLSLAMVFLGFWLGRGAGS